MTNIALELYYCGVVLKIIKQYACTTAVANRAIGNAYANRPNLH